MSMEPKKTVLIVEDEMNIVDIVRFNLQREGYATLEAYDGEAGLALAREKKPDLILLDVMMPKMMGFDVCRALRAEGDNVPVIILTAREEEEDKILGLEIGADDYITKPFNPLELMARVKAQLRRYTRYNEADKAGDCRDIIDFNGLVINRATHECTLYDRELGLTPIEFDILWMLCENRGQVISAERLFESVWGEKYLDRNNTVMVHIRRLREKMGEPSRNPRFIKTVWGVGYKID